MDEQELEQSPNEEQEKEKEQEQTENLIEEKEDPKVSELEASLLDKEEQLAVMQSKVQELENALNERIQADLSALSPEDRSLVEEFGEGDPLKVMKAFSRLAKSGKIQTPLHPALQQRVGVDLLEKPQTPQQAAQAFIDAALSL